MLCTAQEEREVGAGAVELTLVDAATTAGVVEDGKVLLLTWAETVVIRSAAIPISVNFIVKTRNRKEKRRKKYKSCSL